jgi:trehalose-6-phosphate synthase
VAVHYLYRSVSREELVAHYRAADVALVTPLRDGMNLVAHEYVACRPERDGALVLSELAGAAQHLDGALLVNPYNPEAVAGALDEALLMSGREQRRRMALLSDGVGALNVHGWAERFLRTLAAAPPVWETTRSRLPAAAE